MKSRKLLCVGLLAVALILAACGGGSGGDEPTDVVKKVAKAMQELDIDETSKYYCKEMAEELNEGLDLGGVEDMGIDPDEMLEAFKIKMDDMKYEEKSKSGDSAIVRITGKIGMEFDTDKLKSIMKKVLEAEGEKVSDEDLEMVVDMFGKFGGQEIPVDAEVELIKEDGDWVVCSDLDFLGGADLLNLPLP